MSHPTAPDDSPPPNQPIVLLLHCPELAGAFDHSRFEVRQRDSVEAVLGRNLRLQPRVCVVGPALAPGSHGESTRRLRRALPLTDVIVWHPDASPETVREALRAGAIDVVLDRELAHVAETITRVVDEQKLLPRVLESENRDGDTWRFEGLLSRSRRMWDVFETCIRTAGTDASVLILGETGTGKELVARALHRRSLRRGRFVALNCGAVPESLFDSELFGHVEGAFTGATTAKEGLFRHADGGTLFLDEIGSIPISAQFRLLRVLQDNLVRPVGAQEEIHVDVRVIAATSTPLTEAVSEERFREDLLYRLDVIRLIIPPLRERLEDVVFLFGHFRKQFAETYKVRRPSVTDAFLDALVAYDWPGNVRELKNFTERLVLTHPGDRLDGSHFRGLMRNYSGRTDEGDGANDDGVGPVRPAVGLPPATVDTRRPLREVLDRAVESVERAYLEAALRESDGRVGRAAERAGISRRTLLRKMLAHGLDKRTFRARGAEERGEAG